MAAVLCFQRLTSAKCLVNALIPFNDAEANAAFFIHVTNGSHIYFFLNHNRTSGRKVCSLAESLAVSDSFASETVQMMTHDCIKPFYFFQMSWLSCSSLVVLQPSSCPITYLCFGIINMRKMPLIKLLSAVVRFDIKLLIISVLPPVP